MCITFSPILQNDILHIILEYFSCVDFFSHVLTSKMPTIMHKNMHGLGRHCMVCSWVSYCVWVINIGASAKYQYTCYAYTPDSQIILYPLIPTCLPIVPQIYSFTLTQHSKINASWLWHFNYRSVGFIPSGSNITNDCNEVDRQDCSSADWKPDKIKKIKLMPAYSVQA